MTAIVTAGLLTIAYAVVYLRGRGELPTRGDAEVEDTPETREFEDRVRETTAKLLHGSSIERAEMAVQA